MNRKEFLKKVGMSGFTMIGIGILAYNQDDGLFDDIENPVPSGDCTRTNSETAGPYPTKSPEDFQVMDIRGGRTGIDLEVNLTIQSVEEDCVPMENAVVDIWHCDKDGNYSQYGNSGSDHFLRGRQISGEEGKVRFLTIFPGWYQGRATHIHVHIYNQVGTSLLITQIAFPEGNDSAMYTVQTSSGYRGMSGYTYNANDGIFRDGYENELATINGSLEEGYQLSLDLKV